jgi:hypothetical protein
MRRSRHPGRRIPADRPRVEANVQRGRSGARGGSVAFVSISPRGTGRACLALLDRAGAANPCSCSTCHLTRGTPTAAVRVLGPALVPTAGPVAIACSSSGPSMAEGEPIRRTSARAVIFAVLGPTAVWFCGWVLRLVAAYQVTDEACVTRTAAGIVAERTQHLHEASAQPRRPTDRPRPTRSFASWTDEVGFVSLVSHQLQAPLTTVNGALDAARDTDIAAVEPHPAHPRRRPSAYRLSRPSWTSLAWRPGGSSCTWAPSLSSHSSRTWRPRPWGRDPGGGTWKPRRMRPRPGLTSTSWPRSCATCWRTRSLPPGPSIDIRVDVHASGGACR